MIQSWADTSVCPWGSPRGSWCKSPWLSVSVSRGPGRWETVWKKHLIFIDSIHFKRFIQHKSKQRYISQSQVLMILKKKFIISLYHCIIGLQTFLSRLQNYVLPIFVLLTWQICLESWLCGGKISFRCKLRSDKPLAGRGPVMTVSELPYVSGFQIFLSISMESASGSL